MNKSIQVTIRRNGNVVIDYDGFEGEYCFKEAKKLYDQLATLGIKVILQDTRRKSSPVTRGTESVRL